MSRRYVTNMSVLSTCVLLAIAVTTSTGSEQASVAGSGQGSQPRITNAQVSVTNAASGLPQTFTSMVAAQGDAAWIGYAVPVKDRDRVMCCWSNGSSYFSGSMRSSDAPCCGSCRIEPAASTGASGQRTPSDAAAPRGPVKLEGAERMVILFRIAERQIERVRVFSEDCELDAGGRPVRWLDGVRPAESVALLESLVSAEPERKSRITNGALSAIAQHADVAAGGALERLAKSHATSSVRGEALFWLAQRGDANAAPIILNAVDKDPAPEVRKRAVFALAQLRNDGGIDALVRIGRSHADAAVRGEAIFWLGQKAGTKAVGTISEAIEKDPETQVKRRALLALSQLPKDEGVPLLIDIARKNSNPAVRKQAMFWLGQSKDPRAIAFFAEILK